MTDPQGIPRRQALMYGGLAAAAPLLPATRAVAATRHRPGSKPGDGSTRSTPAKSSPVRSTPAKSAQVMSTQLEYAAVMVPANGASWWYYGITGEQVGQFLTQNNAVLTDIEAYVDSDNSLKFIVTMAPGNGAWWGWWWGQTAAQVSAILDEYNAAITKISPYIDPSDRTLKFAVIMTENAPAGWWWYYGITGDQIGPLLTQNNAAPTQISAYIDVDATVKFAVLMTQSQGQWWGYFWGQTAAQVGALPGQYNAMLTDISAYNDPSDNTLKFAVVMAQGQGGWWWWWGQSGAQLGELLAANNAQLTAASGYLASSMNSITLIGTPNISGLNGQTRLVIQESGAYSFSGSWSPSNFFTGLISQDVNFVSTILDARGTAWVFSTSGTVPVEGTYSFNVNGTSAALAEHWQFLQASYSARDWVNANLDLGSTWNDIVNWYNQNQQTISAVVQVVGTIASAVS
jgi:hypothetical protein